MSHEITKIDRQDGTEMAWHKLTKINPKLTLRNSWLNEWDIQKERLSIVGAGGIIRETDFHMLTATDDPKIQIGVPLADSYVPINNQAFIECIENATLGIDGLKLKSVGSIMGRNRVFASFEIGAANFTHGKRNFESFINFSNAHDKSGVFLANTSNTCIVCANTFAMNLQYKGKTVHIRVRHTKNAQIALENMEEIIGGALGAQAEFKQIFESLDEIKTNETEARFAFAGFIGQGKEMSTRASNTVERLTDLFNTGAGNKGETRADVFSAVTDFYSHESSGKGENRMKQWVSSEFGSGAVKKREFLQSITEDYSGLIKKGVESLSLN